ncbi:hypothetical protein BpHYR1_034628 [Brachionus plicatilis]|uniref:Uncharacterized protein n=1 Tax=Brachionus plicatilis TaxID=10195 RepID=A0A3M7T3M5_BRAPC|nr:hypothetical protein BpHYR1_034628 [Brachionus plicatilis]
MLYKHQSHMDIQTAWLHEELILKPNWFGIPGYERSRSFRTSLSKALASVSKMVTGRTLSISFVLLFSSLMTGIIFPTLKKFGTIPLLILTHNPSNSSIWSSTTKIMIHSTFKIC